MLQNGLVRPSCFSQSANLALPRMRGAICRNAPSTTEKWSVPLRGQNGKTVTARAELRRGSSGLPVPQACTTCCVCSALSGQVHLELRLKRVAPVRAGAAACQTPAALWSCFVQLGCRTSADSWTPALKVSTRVWTCWTPWLSAGKLPSRIYKDCCKWSGTRWITSVMLVWPFCWVHM